MAPIVAPSVVRYTVVGTLNGEDCMNIFDYAITDVLLDGGRNEAIQVAAGDLLNQWADHVLPLLSTAYRADEVRWVDLDSADGTTGSRSSTDGSTWPDEGGTAGAPCPNHTYAKIVKNLQGKTRLQRNGTLRLGGLVESYTDAANSNLLTVDTQVALNGAFEALKDGMNGALSGYTGNLVVVHTVDDVYDGDSQIASYSAAAVVGTVRGRMPGYGD